MCAVPHSSHTYTSPAASPRASPPPVNSPLHTQALTAHVSLSYLPNLAGPPGLWAYRNLVMPAAGWVVGMCVYGGCTCFSILLESGDSWNDWVHATRRAAQVMRTHAHPTWIVQMHTLMTVVPNWLKQEARDVCSAPHGIPAPDAMQCIA